MVVIFIVAGFIGIIISLLAMYKKIPEKVGFPASVIALMFFVTAKYFDPPGIDEIIISLSAVGTSVLALFLGVKTPLVSEFRNTKEVLQLELKHIGKTLDRIEAKLPKKLN